MNGKIKNVSVNYMPLNNTILENPQMSGISVCQMYKKYVTNSPLSVDGYLINIADPNGARIMQIASCFSELHIRGFWGTWGTWHKIF